LSDVRVGEELPVCATHEAAGVGFDDDVYELRVGLSSVGGVGCLEELDVVC
jgi:hypothetical protein